MVVSLAACGGDQEPTSPGSTASSSSAAATPSTEEPAGPAELSFGVWGTPAEVAAYEQVVADYNASTDDAEVRLTSWPSSAAMLAALQEGGQVPDVFLLPRGDVPVVSDDHLIRPVDDPLNSRAVDLGDGYSRQAIEAFSHDARLQCMPYGVSPKVVFINTDLVDFDRMRVRELPVTTDPELERWSMEEFTAAAQFATRPRRGVAGLAFDPTLADLAPFVLSGGGSLVDDEEEPTTLTFSDDDTRSALESTLGTLRNAAITMPPEKLAQKPAEEWFKEGKVGMIIGERSLVPELRKVEGLRWDVMPIPRVDSAATVGDYTGLCLSSGSDAPEPAADLLADLVSDEAVATVADTGYLVPVNQRVALSEKFLQTAKQPLNSRAFVSGVRNMTVLPATRKWPALEDAVAPTLRELLTGGPTVDIEGLTERIDQESQTVLGE